MNSWGSHIPVLFGELIQALHFFPHGKNIIIDCTLWLAGHAIGVLWKLKKWDVFIGLDCDKDNLTLAKKNILASIQNKPIDHIPEIYCIHSNFKDLSNILSNFQEYQPIFWDKKTQKIDTITCWYADIGVSSIHFDVPERGFSFRFDGVLDMRLDTSRWITAEKLLETISFEHLAQIIRNYWDETRAWFIAKKIIEAREKWPIHTTFELADIVRKAWKDSVPKVFQAIRIEINQEFLALEILLETIKNLLVPNGIMAIISFHSWEDRIVKNFFKIHSWGMIDNLTWQEISSGALSLINKKPIKPKEAEIQENPRSRSGLLRAARKN